ncbi:MBL fold metallo-hydrolase [Patescibacteria group bacterium]|nr:MBL fold metallo-hydrolase [Patescibacteria group bacterium]
MKVLWKNIFLGLSLALIVIWMAVFAYPEKKLHLIACGVGQGDAILAVYGTTQILIDGGATNKVIDCLGRHMPFWDRKIEVVLLSHPQLDHFGGLSEVFKRFQVERFVATSLDSSSQAYQALISMVGGSGVQVINPTTGMVIRSGLLYLDIVWPLSDFLTAAGGVSGGKVLGAFTSKKDPNNFSVVANLRLGEFDAFLTGDIGPQVIGEIIQTGKTRDVEYIKVPHHGSKNGLTKELLDATTPEVAVISVGKNSFGHPHKEILDLLNEYGIQVKRTDEDGDVEVISDGKSWWIE